jgi:hypothetical protein
MLPTPPTGKGNHATAVPIKQPVPKQGLTSPPANIAVSNVCESCPGSYVGGRQIGFAFLLKCIEPNIASCPVEFGPDLRDRDPEMKARLLDATASVLAGPGPINQSEEGMQEARELFFNSTVLESRCVARHCQGPPNGTISIARGVFIPWVLE